MHAGFLPRDCCRQDSALVTSVDVRSRYALGGEAPWYQCRVCFRTHPFDPSQEKQE